MGFNSLSEANPYARVYNRQRALFSLPRSTEGLLPRSSAQVPPRQRAQSTTSNTSSENGTNPYETLLRDTTQHRVGGGLSTSSAYDIQMLPDEFALKQSLGGSLRDRFADSPPIPSMSQADRSTINKRLISHESLRDLQQLNDPFQQQQEPRTASLRTQCYLGGLGAESACEIDALPEQFCKKIIPRSPKKSQHASTSVISNPQSFQTVNKRLLTAKRQEDLNRLPDSALFPPYRSSSRDKQQCGCPSSTPRSSKVSSYFNSPARSCHSDASQSQNRIGSLGESSQWDIRMLPNPFPARFPRAESYMEPMVNKHLITLQSQADLRAIPDPFNKNQQNSYGAYRQDRNERSDRFDVPRSAYPGIKRTGSNQCLNKYAASTDSMYDLKRLPSDMFGSSNSAYEIRIRDYSRQSLDDLSQLPDPFAANYERSLHTAREKSDSRSRVAESLAEIDGLVDMCEDCLKKLQPH
ncbi:unnamed protein product, partial [Mesorhabditis belari]|uniref:Uncharacterized protein n=1 Tax=Mesorhabditis belari TaxID=2138241 RepID=A0AAF3J7Y4_9BILA